MRRLVRTASFQALHATNALASQAGLKVIPANVLSEEWFRKVGALRAHARAHTWRRGRRRCVRSGRTPAVDAGPRAQSPDLSSWPLLRARLAMMAKLKAARGTAGQPVRGRRRRSLPVRSSRGPSLSAGGTGGRAAPAWPDGRQLTQLLRQTQSGRSPESARRWRPRRHARVGHRNHRVRTRRP